LGLKDGEAIESPILSKIIENSQKKVEELHFDIRRQLLAYDNVMNQQREAIYAERADIIETPNDEMPEYGWEVVRGVVNDILEKYFPEDNSQADGERAAARLKSLFGAAVAGKIASVDNRLDMEGVRDEILDDVKKLFDTKIAELNSNTETDDKPAGVIMRYILLNTLDSAWREHLTGMDELRRGIGLRAIGQKDPLIEYQFESYNLFQEMMERVKDSFTQQAFRVRLLTDDMKRKREMTMEKKEFSMSGGQAHEPATVKKLPKVGRNDPCPCGSGKKYKYCHGRGL
ncbi:MAG: SEC-C domain-containing protein, partial [Synergistaceae bacterium]|nr:SEC-C domain-containing protein [Synergistaceae bacterium]